MRLSHTNWYLRAALVAAVIVGAAGGAIHFAGAGHFAKATGTPSAPRSASSLSFPLFFEPNQGQTDSRVKFLARGSGYGLFLTADEAVLALQSPRQHVSGAEPRLAPSTSVIRMRLAGANSATTVHGAQPLPGKSSYFIGNDRSKWRTGIPQFAQVEYKGVYSGIDLVYYGSQRQLEYDFRVAPGADPSQIALTFDGASTRLDSGDLVLATAAGEVRFHAPRIYQRSKPAAETRVDASSDINAETPVEGSFRQLADNKIGFTVGPYDHSRELVIDPTLYYSTYLGGSGIESLTQIALDQGGNIYVAGSTTSADFPGTANGIQPKLAGPRNIFIAVLNTSSSPQLTYATYFGGSGMDSLAALAVSSSVDSDTSGFDVYVAGTTTSSDFPTSGVWGAFQGGPQTGTHGFVSRINLGTNTLRYSTYLAGNGLDFVTGLAIDSARNAYVTGTTTSTNAFSDNFPANPNAYQLCPFGPIGSDGKCPSPPPPPTPVPPQFFASKIATTGFSGAQSMLYSTYFGGGNGTTTTGGSVAVDTSGNMYFTGGTNMQNLVGTNGTAKFPIVNAYQQCLNQPPGTTTCTGVNPSNRDAVVVKLNPNQVGSASLVYSTYLGGSGDDFGTGIAVDTSSSGYITGSTNSTDWVCSCTNGYQKAYGGGPSDAFIAKVGTPGGGSLPLNYFSYLGGTGADTGQAITVDSIGTAHLAGFSTPGLTLLDPLPQDPVNNVNVGANGDALVAVISTSTATAGDYVTFLGGNQFDQGTSVALDNFNNTYVGGITQSNNFLLIPPTLPPFQSSLNGPQDAFVTEIGNLSKLTVTVPTSSPNPSPVAAGQTATFSYTLTNTGPDPANLLHFYVNVPNTGIASTPTATATGGTCTLSTAGTLFDCFISTLAVSGTSTIAVSIAPSVPPPSSGVITVSCASSVNGGSVSNCPTSTVQQDTIVDFKIQASTPSAIPAGQMASIVVTLTPEPTYNATITMSDSITPTMVTNPSPTFTNSTVTLSGSGQGTTTLNIQTVQRPVTTGSLFRRGTFYATWLPIGGLSLVGLGLGGRTRRRWLAGLALGLLAGLILLQPACSSGSGSVTTATGTAAGTYKITITGSTGTTSAHSTSVFLQVN